MAYLFYWHIGFPQNDFKRLIYKANVLAKLAKLVNGQDERRYVHRR